jgi:superfamily I DNA/RNA helicase
MKISNYQPDTLDDAIKYLYDNLTPEDIKFIKCNIPSSIHFLSGMVLRNNWHLWDKKSNISKDIQKRFGLAHGDDLSGLIHTAIWSKVKGEDVEKALNKCAKRYKTHWKNSGVDAMTGEPLPNRKEPKSMSINLKLKRDGTIEIV